MRSSTTEEVAAFVSDKSPDAYEKVIVRLLASPRELCRGLFNLNEAEALFGNLGVLSVASPNDHWSNRSGPVHPGVSLMAVFATLSWVVG
jgi:hypothetical protein